MNQKKRKNNRQDELKKINKRIDEAENLYGTGTREFRIAERQIKFGFNLMIHRRQAGLSQEELAKQCGVTREYINYIEVGKKKPGKPMIKKLVASTNWNLEEAFTILGINSLSMSGKTFSLKAAKEEFALLLQENFSYSEFLLWSSGLKYRYDFDHVSKSKQSELPSQELYSHIEKFNFFADSDAEEFLFQTLTFREFSLERWVEILNKFKRRNQIAFKDFLNAILLTAGQQEIEEAISQARRYHPELFNHLQREVKKMEGDN